MNEKKQQLVNSALKLFYTNGIHSVGINQVLSSSGIAKKTLYNHFPSKEALVIATLEQRDYIYCQWISKIISTRGDDPTKIGSLFSGLTSWFNNNESALGDFRGCFFINTSTEFSDSTSAVSIYCKAHKNKVREIIKRCLTNQNEELLNALCILKEGAIISSYVEEDKFAAEKCKALAMSLYNN